MEDYKKKYEKTEERAKNIYNSDPYNSIVRAVCEQIFPELKESEDERIKRCIGMCLTDANEQRFEDFNTTLKDCLSWFEKQGEKNLSTDFSDLRTWKYIVDAVWTEKEGIGQYLDSPFTEETAKKLQKRFGNIEQKPADKVEPIKWSDEDENYCLDVNAAVSDYFDEGYAEELKDWLKSLKERYTWKPTDEQMQQLGWVAEQNKDNMIGKELMTLYNDLKKLNEE